MLPEKTRSDIGQRIRQFRTHNDLSQAELADGMDISINFLSEIENGKKGFSYETLYKLCSEYKISADYILFGKSTDSAKTGDIVDIANHLDDEKLAVVIDYLHALKNMREM
jgi:transcriptional regulator with XRE-family HTH domain